jgi:predicted  nucleic acid-binding Zn-ribbon protein
MYCSECGHRFDECNESQPVCAHCGGWEFTDHSPLDCDPSFDDDFDVDNGSDAVDAELDGEVVATKLLGDGLGDAEDVGEKAELRR